MPHRALTFLIMALIAGLLVLGVVAGSATYIAEFLSLVFLIMLVVGMIRGRRSIV